MKTEWNESAIPDVPGESKKKSPPPVPELVDFYSIPLPPEDDPNELLRHRFLCRAGALLLVGQTGIGKSAIAVQCAVMWSIGREAFGIQPRGCLRILIIQAENDMGDMAEFREGMLKGLAISEEDRAKSVIRTARVDSVMGADFCEHAVEPLLEMMKPDLLIIDPALSYLGGEANQQRDVSMFLRNGLNPLLHKFNCGLVLIHHTNKPAQGDQKAAWQGGDFAYLGSGSAEWANWARAAIVVRALGGPRDDYYEFRVAKRGRRLRWTEDDGDTPKFTRIIAHSALGICWREVTEAEYEAVAKPETKAGKFKPELDRFMEIFPGTFSGEPRNALLSAEQIKNAFYDRGWHKDFYKGLCDEAEASGKIGVTRIGRLNQVLRGLPDLVATYEKRVAEAGTMMQEVPLKAPLNARRKRRK